MRIVHAAIEAIPEPLVAAFGFKGSYSSQPMWNTVVRLTGQSGQQAMGLSNQGITWSDASVSARYSSTGGNALMYLMSEYALQRAQGMEFDRPDQLLRQLLPDVWAYGKKLAGQSLRETFALNALVALDTAAWLLWAKGQGITTFDDLIPAHARPWLAHRHSKVAAVPLITYSADMDAIRAEVDSGHFVLKVKLGSDPDRDGDPDKMLAWDMQRLRDIHALLKDKPCAYTDFGGIPYYLDINGRYDSMDQLRRLLDVADDIGMLERIVLLEEPFPETLEVDVSALPVRIAADESAHSDLDIAARLDMGYSAFALKPIAKTMSMTFDMIAQAGQHNAPCFCADLTVNASMVDLNKNFAARLAPLPGLQVALLESNGGQYYARWDEMIATLPYPDGAWVRPRDGLYMLDDAFYETSGGLFMESSLYGNVL
ncbi:MAG: L-alanine-DL-glutamate epimerase [Christensenellales bacterium]|jgi:L-alanine-DL-glutamate epimerase-like enolase superfamily enzyme